MKKPLKNLSILFISLLLFSAISSSVQAQVRPLRLQSCQTLGIFCPTVAGEGTVRTLVAAEISRIMNIILFLVGIVAVIMIIYAGVRYILARGDEKEAEAAKHIIIYVVIGLIVIGLSWSLVTFVISIFDVNAPPPALAPSPAAAGNPAPVPGIAPPTDPPFVPIIPPGGLLNPAGGN